MRTHDVIERGSTSHAFEVTSCDPGKQKNILIVDDNESIIETLSILLHDEAIVSTASNGLDALSKYASKYFDCIISDIEMPLMNGVDLYKYVVRINPGYKNRFLFFSGTTNVEHTSYLLMNNLTLLRKPHDIIKLKYVVHQFLQDESTDSIGNVETINRDIDIDDIYDI